jgi:integrase
MTPEQIESLVNGWLASELDYAEECRITAGPLSDARLEGELDGLDIMAETTREALLGNDFRKIEIEANELIKAAGFPPMDRESAEYGRLCRRLLRARLEYTRIETERWNGEYHEAPSVTQRIGPSSLKATLKASKTFVEVVALYFKECSKAKRTDSQMQAEFEKFLKPLGQDISIRSITKDLCRQYKESLLHERSLSQTTCVKHLSSLSTLFKWAEAQGFVDEGVNPVRGLIPNKRQAKKTAAKRRPFTDEELLTVFGSQDFKAQREIHPERYWISLICLFGACRREEASQLYCADVQKQDGMWYFHLTNEEADQNLKTGAISKRRLPIHSSLIHLGILEFIEGVKATGESRLFPSLRKGRNGFGDAVGKYFSRLITHLGLTDSALVMHSLRHGGITKLHAAGVPENIVKMLVGHSESDVHHTVYVQKDLIPLQLLRDGIEKLRYDDIEKALTKA